MAACTQTRPHAANAVACVPRTAAAQMRMITGVTAPATSTARTRPRPARTSRERAPGLPAGAPVAGRGCAAAGWARVRPAGNRPPLPPRGCNRMQALGRMGPHDAAAAGARAAAVDRWQPRFVRASRAGALPPVPPRLPCHRLATAAVRGALPGCAVHAEIELLEATPGYDTFTAVNARYPVPQVGPAAPAACGVQRALPGARGGHCQPPPHALCIPPTQPCSKPLLLQDPESDSLMTGPNRGAQYLQAGTHKAAPT